MRELDDDDLTQLATATCRCGMTWDIWVTEMGRGRRSDAVCPTCDNEAFKIEPYESLA